jgi:hypothetical protein
MIRSIESRPRSSPAESTALVKRRGGIDTLGGLRYDLVVSPVLYLLQRTPAA